MKHSEAFHTPNQKLNAQQKGAFIRTTGGLLQLQEKRALTKSEFDRILSFAKTLGINENLRKKDKPPFEKQESLWKATPQDLQRNLESESWKK